MLINKPEGVMVTNSGMAKDNMMVTYSRMVMVLVTKSGGVVMESNPGGGVMISKPGGKVIVTKPELVMVTQPLATPCCVNIAPWHGPCFQDSW